MFDLLIGFSKFLDFTSLDHNKSFVRYSEGKRKMFEYS